MINKITLIQGSSSQFNRKSKMERLSILVWEDKYQEARKENSRMWFNRKLEAGLGERKSILKGAFDLCEERGGQASKPCNQTSLVDGFDLFGHGFGRKG